MLDVVIDTLVDSIKLLPFLFIAYIIMEYIEHKTSKKTEKTIKKAGRLGPLMGGILGIFPQCGFSAAASNLYAGRIISLGTLIAIFLSTSDEMLPILLSEGVNINIIIQILLIKLVIGIIFGFIIDLFMSKHKKNNEESEISHVCEHDKCHCEEEGIIKSSIKHTISIFIFILIVSFILNVVIFIIGEEQLSNLILNKPILGPIIAGFIGLIPNCASSVIITQLYLQNMITVSTMIAGLLVNAGVGLLVLFKENKNTKENVSILVLLYSIGVLSGIVMGFLGITI